MQAPAGGDPPGSALDRGPGGEGGSEKSPGLAKAASGHVAALLSLVPPSSAQFQHHTSGQPVSDHASTASVLLATQAAAPPAGWPTATNNMSTGHAVACSPPVGHGYHQDPLFLEVDRGGGTAWPTGQHVPMANPHHQLPVFPGFLPGNFPGFPGGFPGAQALMAGFPTVPSPLFGAAGAYGFIPGSATLGSQFPEHLAARPQSVFGPPMGLPTSGRNPAKNKSGNKKRKAVGAGRKGGAPKRKQR